MPRIQQIQQTRPKAAMRQPGRSLILLFVLLILAGALLLTLPFSSRAGETDWSTAIFTATSAVCVTGLVVVDTATFWSFPGQIVILALIQLGGLGYMAASTFITLIFGRQPGLHSRMVLRGALGEVTLADTLRLLWSALRFTLIVEVIGAVVLTARFAQEPGRPLDEAIWRGSFHSISAFCNAGFDLFGLDRHPISSLGGFQDDWIVNLTVAALIIVGGLGFPVCLELFHYARERPHRPFSLHTRLVLSTSAILIVVGMIGITVGEWSNPRTLGNLPPEQRLLAGFFQSITCRTAGFSTIDIGGMRSISLMVMGILMVIGASPSGTGGGLKTTTFAVMLASVRASLRGQDDVEVFGRRLGLDAVYRALVLVVLSLAMIIGGTFVLVFTEPAAITAGGIRDNLFVRIQFEVMSAFGTVGLSTGITPLLTEPGRLVLIVLMFVGRLGPITVATAWTARAMQPRRRLAEERVPLG